MGPDSEVEKSRLSQQPTPERAEEETPTIGRIVLYGAGAGAVLPAIITHVWNPTCVNLFVFPDGSYTDAMSGSKTSVLKGNARGDWMWPRRATLRARLGIAFEQDLMDGR